MDNQENRGGNLIAIVTMFALYGMVGFVTNLAAPVGKVWMRQPGITDTMSMLGNLMNFVPYLIMGIPAGKLLTKIGYKATALWAIAIGFVGLSVQLISGNVLDGAKIGDVPTAFYIYLLGAFICGFCVCMLNTVVNPMLNTIGGGGKRGNALNTTGSSLNSLACTLAPILVGAMAGDVAKAKFADLNSVMFVALGIFAFSFLVIAFLKLQNPETAQSGVVYERSPLAFRHCLLGVIGILAYMGVEVGIPNVLNLWFEQVPDVAKNVLAWNVGFKTNPTEVVAAVGGAVVGTYWFLMLVGRLVGGIWVAKHVSSKTMLTFCAAGAIVLIVLGVLTQGVKVSMPVFSVDTGFATVTVPATALFFVLCGLCTSVMWAGVFNLAVEGLGKYTEKASGIFMTMVVGGGVLPLLQTKIAGSCGYMVSYLVPGICLAYMLCYALFFSKNVNTDIKVD